MSYVAASVTPADFSPWRSDPFVNDDFGDVFGFFFAISGDSFTNPELVRYAEQLRRELVLVPGVGKVAIGGVIPQQINVDISLAKMAARGITLNQLAAILTRLNVVSSAGEIRVGSESIRLHPTGEFQSIDELGICWSALTAPAPPLDCGILPRCRAG